MIGDVLLILAEMLTFGGLPVVVSYTGGDMYFRITSFLVEFMYIQLCVYISSM